MPGHSPAREIVGALNAGGLPALVTPNPTTGLLGDDTIVAWYAGTETEEPLYLTLECAYGWLALPGNPGGNDSGQGLVVDALNVGGSPALPYSGPDPDNEHGNTVITSHGEMTVVVTLGWPAS